MEKASKVKQKGDRKTMNRDEEGLPIPDQPHLQENKGKQVFKFSHGVIF